MHSMAKNPGGSYLMLKDKKKKYPKWLERNLKQGFGKLATYFVEKLDEGEIVVQKCVYCGNVARKWSRTCPNCRNTFTI